jgi:hypothetical protein
MARPLQAPLVVAWAGIGILAGVALSDPFTRLILLLVPTGLLAAWLLWNFAASRELGAVLIGLCVLPAILGISARNPGCPVDSGFASCEPGSPLPWVVAALLLALIVSSVLASDRTRPKAPVASTTKT